MAEARARRAAKDVIEVDSESGSSVLLSPRDKALRAEIKKKELQKKERGQTSRRNGTKGKDEAASSSQT
jgi:hypothetical protein